MAFLTGCPLVIVAAVPLKRLAHAKSRLQSVLSPTQRADLAVHMVSNTVRALQMSRAFDRIMLVSEEQSVADALGVEVLPDGPSLNDALAGAARWAEEIGAESLLIAVADLPQFRSRHVDLLLRARPKGPGVVLARTDDGGTAALLLSPPGVIGPRFGPGSGSKHALEATKNGIPLREILDESLSQDLDTAADLDRFRECVQMPAPQ